MKSDHLVEIACFVKHETLQAWLINDGHHEVWIPKSQAEYEDDAAGKNGIITMPEWLAKEKELI